MKKIISTITCIIGFVAMSFAQDAMNTATTMGHDALVASKASGEFVYTLPSEVTNETVEKSAAYYTSYFTVDFNDAENVATLNMVTNDEKSRYVMLRFLTSCGVRYVKVDGETLEYDKFVENYLN